MFFFLCPVCLLGLGSDFLDADMTRTKSIIAYISPLLSLQCTELEEFITRYVPSKTPR